MATRYSREVRNSLIGLNSGRAAGIKVVNDAYKRIDAGIGTEADRLVMANFMAKCRELEQALSVRNGNSYFRCNYFAVMPHDMMPLNFRALTSKLVKSKTLSAEDKKFLTTLRERVGRCFSDTGVHDGRNSEVLPTNRVLKDLRAKVIRHVNGKEVVNDYTSDEKYDELCKTVDEIIEMYNLPKYSYAVFHIGKDVTTGKSMPICLDGVTPAKVETQQQSADKEFA